MRKLKISAGIVILAAIVLASMSQTGGKMTTLSHQIRIDAPKDQVFATLANLELVADYNDNIQTARYITPNHSGIGAARECFLGKQGTIRERVTGFEDGRQISMEMYEHNWPLRYMNWTTQVEDDGIGTVVSQSLNYEMKFGMLGLVLDRLFMKNKMDNSMDEVSGRCATISSRRPPPDPVRTPGFWHQGRR